MAETDKEQQTEAPTDKRLEEAREEGQLPVSREIATWTIFVASLIVVAWLGPTMGREMIDGFRPFLEQPHEISLEGLGIQVLAAKTLAGLALSTVLVFSILSAGAILGTMVQTGFYVNPAKLKFNFERVFSLQGFKTIFSQNALAELVKSFLKLVVLGGVAVTIFIPLIQKLPLFVGQDLMATMAMMHHEAVHLMVVLMTIITVIAVADIVYQRYQYYKGLRMSKQEVKDERKQSEGDPLIRARLRGIRIEKARRRMMAQVPKADVVITNPTHYAVALQYDNAKMAAPVVLAKGIDVVALRIREVAEESEIPLVSNPPLARTLYETVDLDKAIQPEHYRAVAEVISFVYKLRKKKITIFD
jgi:flagellar biosynthetic protein FlhB